LTHLPRLYASRKNKDQEVDSPVDSSGNAFPSKFYFSWKSFIGGLAGGVVLSAGLVLGTLTAHVEDPDGLYESTALFSNILTEVEIHVANYSTKSCIIM
jgi:hypothetical protein